ncbi:MAG: hypothetical protein B7X56_06395, partial [Burkholderiales bacterium 34-67-9]
MSGGQAEAEQALGCSGASISAGIGGARTATATTFGTRTCTPPSRFASAPAFACGGGIGCTAFAAHGR